MSFNYSALRGKIREQFSSEEAFAYSIGLSTRSLSLKLNNKVGWKQTEIYKAIELLDIPPEEIPHYFFNRQVQSN